jgi:polysaccharide deacetylase family sporulation protein PdaB
MLVMYLRRRALLTAMIILALACAALIFKPLWSYYFSAQVSTAKRLVPVYKVDTGRQAVALSFDASWGAEHTPRILDVLDEFGVKATFFLVNIWLEDYPEMAREIAAHGHEIGLHSATHPHFTALSAQQMTEEVRANAELVRQVIGCECQLFRPPFGDYDNRVLTTVEGQGYQVIQWSVDSLDWQDLSAAEILGRVMKKIGPGDIVLFHNNGLHTAEALPDVLRQLKEKGLAAIPISELLLKGDCYTDHNGVQRSAALDGTRLGMIQ